MSYQCSPHFLLKALKGAVEVGGARELRTLTRELNKMPYQKLYELSEALVFMDRMESIVHDKQPSPAAVGQCGRQTILQTDHKTGA